MTSGIELRSATPEDAASIAAIQRDARVKAMPWLPVLHTPEEVLMFFERQIRDGDMCTIVTVGGHDAGFICVDGDWVNHLYIHPSHWRCGLGKHLLDTAKAASPQLQLWTFQGNANARVFYAAQGFEEVELTDGAGNEERMPDVRLLWKSAQS